MRYLGEGSQEPLAWLAALVTAALLVATCPADDVGLELLEAQLTAMLAAGGKIVLTAPVIPAAAVGLQQRFPGQVRVVRAPGLPDGRIGVRGVDGSASALVGAASLTGAGLTWTGSGVLLDGGRNGAAAAQVVEALLTEAPGALGLLVLEDLLAPTMDGLEAAGRLTQPGPRTGLAALDAITAASAAGQLWVVSGPSGVGKTVLALASPDAPQSGRCWR